MSLDISQESIVTEYAILVHKIRGKRNSGSYFLEKVIFDAKGNSQSPKPLDEDTLVSLGQALRKKVGNIKPITCQRMINEQLIFIDQYAGRKKIVWAEKERKREMLIKRGSSKESYIVKVPNTVFAVNHKSVSVFAVKKYPLSSNEKLYQAPYMNTGKTGSVCMGTGMNGITAERLRSTGDINDLIEMFSNAFWGSYFSEIHNNAYPLDKMWKNASDKKFDYSILKESENYITVNDVI